MCSHICHCQHFIARPFSNAPGILQAAAATYSSRSISNKAHQTQSAMSASAPINLMPCHNWFWSFTHALKGLECIGRYWCMQTIAMSIG